MGSVARANGGPWVSFVVFLCTFSVVVEWEDQVDVVAAGRDRLTPIVPVWAKDYNGPRGAFKVFGCVGSLVI